VRRQGLAEIVSVSNALPKLREKAIAYLNAGALDSWIVFPRSRQIEIFGPEGRRDTTSFSVDLTALFQ
jgi:Uma2 family endonuclease